MILPGFIFFGAIGTSLTMDAFMGGQGSWWIAALLYIAYGIGIGVPVGWWLQQ